MDSIPVIIAGSGPTGLTLAFHLSKCGISVLVVEKREPFELRSVEFKNMSKALAIHARTLEHLRIMDLSDIFLSKGFLLSRLSFDGSAISLTEILNHETEFPFVMALSQSESELILYERCKEQGVKFQWFTKLLGVRQDDDHVYLECVVSEPGKEDIVTSIQGLYLAGCDGSHSAVRTCSNIPFEGHNLEHLFLMFDATIDVDLNEMRMDRKNLEISPGVNFQVPQILIPRDSGSFRYIVEYPYNERSHIPEPLPVDYITNIFHQLNPGITKISNLTWSTQFTVRESLAERYRVGRVFLAGDACHVHPPVGGMGMNTGMQDAIQLAWRLSYVLLGKVLDKEAFLDGYNTERRPVGEALVKRTSMGLDVLPILGLAAQTMTYLPESFRVSVMKNISMLQTSYANSPTVKDTPSPSFTDFFQTPLKSMYSLMGLNLVAGDRAPHGILSPLGDEKQTISLYSLLAQSFMKHQLFLLVETNFELAVEVVHKWKAFIDDSFANVTVLLKSSNLGKDVETLFADIDVYYDVDGRLWQHYSGWELVLVRPDAYMEFVGNLADFEKLKQQLESIYVVRK